MLTTLGVLEEPLGNTRLHVARLVASLLYTSSASHAVVAQELCRLNTMDLLLVRWAGMLHFQSTTLRKWEMFHSCWEMYGYFFFSGVVLQIYMEQLPAPPSGAMCCSHPSALCPWNETSAWLRSPGKTQASSGCFTRAGVDWNLLWTSSHPWKLCT